MNLGVAEEEQPTPEIVKVEQDETRDGWLAFSLPLTKKSEQQVRRVGDISICLSS